MTERRTFVPPKHSIAQVFVLVLLGIFAVMSTLMVLLSAQMYRGVVSRTEQNSTYRILTSYVSNAVRASDAENCVYTDHRNGVDMLVLTSEIDGDAYETLIYCHGGMLRELFADADQEFDPEYGEIICSAQSFAAQIDNDLLTVTLTDGTGGSATIDIALSCSQEDGNEQ